MGKLFGLLWNLLALFAVATLFSLAGIGAYLWRNGQLDPQRIERISQVMRGIEPAPPLPSPEKPPLPPSPEELAAKQSIEMRNLELREQSLSMSLTQLKVDRSLLAAERRRFDYEVTAFEQKLSIAADDAVKVGRENVRQIWDKLKPKQAKEQILIMLDADEMEEVVRLMANLPNQARSKIAAEFKTPEDQKKLADIMRLMRAGYPDAETIQEAREKTGSGKATQ